MERITLLFLFSLLSGCISTIRPTPARFLGDKPTASLTSQKMNIISANQNLNRSINLGDALEAPVEGQWGVTLQEDYFRTIANAGFTAVRIPIRFSAHSGEDPPYLLDQAFMERIDWVVRNASDNGLVAILDMHHYLELFSNPDVHQDRFIALWQQISEHYRYYPDDRVYFEILNEPNDNLEPAKWNNLLVTTLTTVRRSNPIRPVIIDSANWGSFDGLSALELPEDDHLIVSFHYYLPFEFTHQGADWVDGSDAWLGTTWGGTPTQVAAIAKDFNIVSAWAAANNRPIFLGEFGSYSEGDQASRLRWTTAVRQAAEAHGFSWGYWEFCSGFGIYDPVANQWRRDLLEALIPIP